MQPLGKTLKGLNQALHGRHAAALLNLETLYRQLRTQPRLSVKDVIKVTRLHNRIALCTPELYLFVIAVMLLLLFTGSFASHALWTPYTRHIFIGSLLILAFIVPLGMNYAFMPLHLVGNLSLPLVTGLMLTVSTGLITFLAPFITSALTGDALSASLDTALPVFSTLIFGGALLLMRNHDRVCYHYFKRCYPDTSLHTTLPPGIHGNLHAMEAQDHYVLFITDHGEDLQRMTLTEAIAMVPQDSGLRVHRSHWVAKSQIMDLVQVQQKYTLVMRNGRQVPVGKAKVEAVRALL